MIEVQSILVQKSLPPEGGRGNWVFPRVGKQGAKRRQKPRVSGERSDVVGFFAVSMLQPMYTMIQGL